MSDTTQVAERPVQADIPASQVEAAEEQEFDALVSKHAKKAKAADKAEAKAEKADKAAKAEAKVAKAAPAPEPEPDDSPEPAPAPEPEPAPEEEPAPEPEKPATRKIDDASRFAAIARREKAAREVEARAKQQEQAAAERLKEVESRITSAQKWEQEFEGIRKNPMQLLKKAGYSLEDVVKYVLNDEQATPDLAAREVDRAIQKQIKALEDRFAAKEQTWQQEKAAAEKAQFDRSVEHFRSRISDHLSANADALELTHAEFSTAAEAENEVFELIRLQYQSTGDMLTIEEASERVETFLEERAEKLLKTKKLAGRIQPGAQSTLKRDIPPTRERTASTKQITNSQASSAGPGDADALLAMGDDEGMEFLAAKIRARRQSKR
jgi:hypothetical protein